jgi:hypothetical protein
MLNRFELALLFLGMGLAFLLGRGNRRGARRVARGFYALANRRELAILVSGLVGAGGSAGISFLAAWPEPKIHDEFSYLLAADTFAAGRLTNPAHPLWVYFESIHVNQQPTYGSRYPPAQALFLALGQVLSGQPILGVWLSFGLACAAVCWMLEAWLPPRWALFGGLLAAVRLGFLGSWAGLQGYWSQSYWGGAVAMLGGALVFGALRRLVRQPQAFQAILLAVGLAVLANSRPFEGLIASFPVGVLLLAFLPGTKAPPWRVGLGRILVPVLLVLGLTVGGMAYFNRTATGHPLQFPYQLNEATYSIVPLFLWQPLRPEPAYHHEVIRAFQVEWSRDYYVQRRTVDGYARDVLERVNGFFSFFFGIALLPPVLAFPWAVRDRWMRFAAATCGLVLGALLVTTAFQPHYFGPIAGLVFALVVQGLRHLRLWHWHGLALGRMFVRVLPGVYLGSFLVALAVTAQVDDGAWHQQRARLVKQLEQDEDRHLVIVRYGQDHSLMEEWVYNRADIDAAKVLWAHDMGDEANRPLLEYFKGRRVWLLEADAPARRLVPYPSPPRS